MSLSGCVHSTEFNYCSRNYLLFRRETCPKSKTIRRNFRDMMFCSSIKICIMPESDRLCSVFGGTCFIGPSVRRSVNRSDGCTQSHSVSKDILLQLNIIQGHARYRLWSLLSKLSVLRITGRVIRSIISAKIKGDYHSNVWGFHHCLVTSSLRSGGVMVYGGKDSRVTPNVFQVRFLCWFCTLL